MPHIKSDLVINQHQIKMPSRFYYRSEKYITFFITATFLYQQAVYTFSES